jgi:hypothetical protein
MKNGMDGQSSCLKKAFCLVVGLTAFGLADNPISTYHYLADPGATADDDYFYIITDSDDPAPYNSNGYKIYALYGFRSKDMQNWTDFGIIYDARKVDGIGAIWASGIDIKDGKFYIIFPDGGGSVGLIKADNFEGPYTNAVGGGKNKLVGGGGQVGCGDVEWCFDPSIFVDDDGSAWMTYGGGENATRPNTDNINMYKMNDNMDGLVTSTLQHVKVNNLPKRKILEASYIHKYKGNYYFSYSTGWQDGAPTIDYAMSDKITGPYTWKGTILDDPNINGVNINGNNNHHGLAEFKGHWYAVYHDRRIAKGHNGLEIIPAEDGMPKPNEGYHRSVSVDEMFYNADGTIQKVKFTNEGPEQIANFDPYDWYPALTSSKQKGIRSRSNFTPGVLTEHLLLPLSTKESWIRVSGVDFGTAATGFTVEAASTTDDNTIEIRTGSATGTLAGTCSIQKTANKSTFVENKCDVEGLSGIVNYVFLVFKGKQDSTMAIKAWGFEGSGSTPDSPQQPFGGVAATIPGKIEAENFDVPGVGRGSNLKSYYDSDSEDHGAESNGGVSYREGTGVDIYKKATGYIVGYNANDEWLEYTVNVTEAGEYTIFAAVATDNETSGFTLSLDGEELATFATKGTSFDSFDTVQANATITETGEHILRMTVTGAWFDVDFFAFAKGADAKIEDTPTALPKLAQFNAGSSVTYSVFDLRGSKVAAFTVNNGDNVDMKATVTNLVKRSGFYLLKPSHGGAVKRIAVTK